MKRGKFGVALVTATALFLTATPAMASVDSTYISTATKKKKKVTKKKATPIYYATLNDGTRAQCTITGTAGGNKIQGTPGNDIICGLGGNDKIYGNGGNDFIDGGTGNDLIVAGEGDDLVNGGTGADKLDGSNGDDVIAGGAGNDTVSGSNGIDEVSGEQGNDKISGGTGDDLLQGGVGTDKLLGEDGNDELDGGTGKDSIVGGTGFNTCVRDTADRGPQGCYFDNSDPIVTDAWTDPAVIDTSTGPQTFNVYVKLHDDTGGFGIYNVWSGSSVNLNFSKLSTDGGGHTMLSGINSMNGQVTIASCSKVERTLASQPWMMKPIGCRVGGDRMDPLIRITYTLPQYSIPGTYQLTNLFVSDAAGNRVNYQYRQCDTCTGWADSNTRWIQDTPALNRASVMQAGPGDVTPPLIQSVEYRTNIDTSSGDQLVEAIVRASDDIGFNSSNQWTSTLHMNFQNMKYMNGYQGQIPMNSNIYGSASAVMCDQPSYLNGGMHMGCQISPGVFKVLIRIPQSLEDGTYQLTNINLVDSVGNSRNYVSCWGCIDKPATPPMNPNDIWLSDLPSSGNLVKTGYVAPNMGAAPKLISFTVDTPQVNSAGSEVAAMTTVVIQDDDGFGSTGSYVNLGFSRSATDMNGQLWGNVNAFSTVPNGPVKIPNCSELNNFNLFAGCIRSQSGNTYTLQIPVRLQAHQAQGTYLFTNMHISDGKNVIQIYNLGATNRPPGSAVIEDLIGSRPSFVNSY